MTFRRAFLKTALAVGGAATGRRALGAPLQDAPAERITIAQIAVTRIVKDNLGRMRQAFTQAKQDGAGWIQFPEGALSGYWGGFDQAEVAGAFEEVRALCAETKVVGLIGTCWREKAARKPHNQIRILDRSGILAARYAKTCLTYGDARDYSAGGFPLVHTVEGIKVGTLICNDLWVTPGYTDGPNPHLTLRQAKAGARVIFHAVNSGNDQRFREYHESNLKLRAAEARCPIVIANAAVAEGEVNCASGVVVGFDYARILPRQGEAVETVEFRPAAS